MHLTLVAALGLGVLASGCGGGGSRAVIQNKGSDTLFQVALAWAENYKKVDPSVAIAVNGGGSGPGISNLINGTSDITNSSRKMTAQELEAAKAKGITPVEHVVGYDAITIYVHKQNPIESITLAQLAEIYGDAGKTVKWSQLGLKMPNDKSDEIIRASRQNNSGTYEYFKEAVLGKGREFKLASLDLHGSTDVVDLIKNTMGAIGYSGLAFATDQVKLVPVTKAAGDKPVAASPDSARDRSYPISRPLFMYTAGQPKGKVKEYLDWILSDAGQRVILSEGYAPLRKLEPDPSPQPKSK